jgi:hypothetical protein
VVTVVVSDKIQAEGLRDFKSDLGEIHRVGHKSMEHEECAAAFGRGMYPSSQGKIVNPLDFERSAVFDGWHDSTMTVRHYLLENREKDGPRNR